MSIFERPFYTGFRYLDDLLNIDNPYFEQMVGQIYPTELQLNKGNFSDTEAPFTDLNLSITNGIVSSKIYDKRDDFNFEIVNFPFLNGDVPRSPSCGVYISQLIRFARVCSNVDDFNNRNLFLRAKLLKQGYRYTPASNLGYLAPPPPPGQFFIGAILFIGTPWMGNEGVLKKNLVWAM